MSCKLLERSHEHPHVVMHTVRCAIKQSTSSSLFSDFQIEPRDVDGIDVHEGPLTAVPADGRISMIRKKRFRNSKGGNSPGNELPKLVN